MYKIKIKLKTYLMYGFSTRKNYNKINNNKTTGNTKLNYIQMKYADNHTHTPAKKEQ